MSQRAAKRQRGNQRHRRRDEHRSNVADEMRRAEHRNVHAHQGQQVNEARQALERRLAERATTNGTVATPEVDPGPEAMPLPDEPIEPEPDQATVPDFDEAFWSSRESLAHIRDYALACMVSAWGFLGVLIVYALDSVPYSTALPGIADDPAPGSLNTIVGLVAESGGNKSRILRTVRAYIDRSDLDIPIGSGEGIAKAYVRRPQQNRRPTGSADDANTFRHGTELYEWQRRNAVFTASEVDTLAALMKRSSATLAGALRQAFSGETLGFAYADETKRALVPDGGYRFGLIVGIQPRRSAALLDDADGGTPQRVLWMPVADPRCRRDNRPPLPAPYTPACIDLWPNRISLPPVATEAIEIAAEERAQGDGNPLDGHHLFVRAKVAAALAVIDGRTAVTTEDWQLSATVMRVSDSTRSRCIAALRTANEQANRARAEAEGIRTDITEETRQRLTVERVERVAQTIVRAVTTHGTMTRSDARKRVSGRDRVLYDDAIEWAVDAGLLEADDEGVRLP
ncbi:hypothetical protein [Gordonia sp. NB41Y]|uniref:hypothetical protein n=1 Tax=Gordonia sp. NB41Y TaxID=875808 RepID=UPI0002BDA78A|nr:hypothetical protein [Gordonia sp. NB41Y]EMP14888.1 hypothetical protein ISGA_2031 [Gordonia sp. NB41Y]WLP89945.1 hypothetical protein Q9K23_20790 [Gordonia sp. NB41Y]